MILYSIADLKEWGEIYGTVYASDTGSCEDWNIIEEAAGNGRHGTTHLLASSVECEIQWLGHILKREENKSTKSRFE